MRYIAITILLVLVATVLWNFLGRVSLKDVDAEYAGSVFEGSLDGAEINAEGVALVREWVENKSRPSVDPVKIFAHQFWYNAVTQGYDIKLWMEPREYSSDRELYGIYQKDNYLVLRIEYRRRNRVLVLSFTAAELEAALEPFIVTQK